MRFKLIPTADSGTTLRRVYTMGNFADAVAPALTLNNAREYAAQTDKYLWVEYHILDALDIRATDARVNWIEDQFDALLASVTL